MDSEKSLKVSQNINCLLCDYNTCKQTDFKKHLSTDKHKKRENGSKMVVNGSEMVVNNDDLSQKVARYTCQCGKIYKYDSGYYRHKKKCSQEIKIDEKDEVFDKDLIMMLLKQNNELQNKVLELCKNGISNTNSNNINSNNKSFNLQFFLNETCKDAMNIMDFVESIKLQLSDLINLGEVGYVEGISSIITKNLNALDVTKRPVHCTDKKREIFYIKDENKWEKEDDEKKTIRKVIKKVVTKNQRLLLKFKETYPDYKKYHSKYSDQYNKLLIEAMGGSGNNDLEKENKIIRNISEATTIDKASMIS